MTVSVDPSQTFAFASPVRLHFERGAVDRLGDFAGDARRVLLVTGRASARRSGLIDRITAALRGREVRVFDEVEPNPSIETVERGGRVAAEAGAELVIGVGGGSAMDAAKVIAALAANSEGFRELLGRPSYPRRPLRILAIPTTCGTGSEANPYAIITDVQAGDKLNFAGEGTWPELGLLDPTVLKDLPREVLVFTALDAFTHAMEGYTSRRSEPFADALALQAMGLVAGHLPPAAEGDEAAKANLLYASALAGIVIAHTGTTVLHALGYWLTLRHDIPHGRANAILIPLLLEHLRENAPAKAAAVLGFFGAGGAVRGGVDAVREYLRRVGIEPRLGAHGIHRGEFDTWADYTLTKRNTASTVGAIDRRRLVELMEQSA